MGRGKCTKLGRSVFWTYKRRKRRVRVMRRSKERASFVLIVRMSIPLLFPTTSALTA
jgi:hypothetical protein